MGRLLLALALLGLTCQSDVVSVLMLAIICYHIYSAFTMCLTTMIWQRFTATGLSLPSRNKRVKSFLIDESKCASHKHTSRVAVGIAMLVGQSIGPPFWSRLNYLSYY